MKHVENCRCGSVGMIIDPLCQQATEREAAKETLRFVTVKFPGKSSREYTYRVEPSADVRPGQSAVTRRASTLVTITAIDTVPVPNLHISKYDWVDPIPVESEETGLAGYSNNEEEKERQ